MGNVQDSFFELLPHMVEVDVDNQGRIEYADTRFEYIQTGMFSELFYAMEEAADENIRHKISEFGVQAGENITKRMNQDFKDVNIVQLIKLVVKSGFNISAIRDISSTENKAQLEKIIAYGAYVGWFESAKVKEYDENVPRLEIDIEKSFEVESYNEEDSKGCMFLPGVCRGIMAQLWDLNPEELTQREEKCSASGDKNCKVVVEKE
jgi:predicted hydrocarbon binding protein